MKYIQLTRGAVATVSDKDYSRVKQHSWCLLAIGYAMTRIKGKAFYLHDFIVGEKGGKQIDHKDRNKLNNTRSNLRLATRSQQRMNEGLRADNISGFRGIHFHRASQKWMVRVNKKYIGLFMNKEDAARAYNKHAIKIHGKFASLNKI